MGQLNCLFPLPLPLALLLSLYLSISYYISYIICIVTNDNACNASIRNVMLEVRAGTGGDEASIWAGDLITVYSKYAETEGWTVSPVSDTQVGVIIILSFFVLFIC